MVSNWKEGENLILNSDSVGRWGMGVVTVVNGEWGDRLTCWESPPLKKATL